MSEERCPAGRVAHAGMHSTPLDVASLAAAVDDPAAGAVATFGGMVRNHDRGRAVSGIEYLAHPGAEEVLAEVAGEIARRHPLEAVAVAHRTGNLMVGEVALACAVSAAHRAEAFTAVQELVDQVKLRLPVWKRQVFPDGSHEWSGSA